jgi:hypothetical protein
MQLRLMMVVVPGLLRATCPLAAGVPVPDLPPLATRALAWLADAPLAIVKKNLLVVGGPRRQTCSVLPLTTTNSTLLFRVWRGRGPQTHG